MHILLESHLESDLQAYHVYSKKISY